jgi:hypothetical protein
MWPNQQQYLWLKLHRYVSTIPFNLKTAFGIFTEPDFAVFTTLELQDGLSHSKEIVFDTIDLVWP